MLIFEFIILLLATYGLSVLMTSYDGAYGVFRKIRNSYPASALKCNVCTSVWVAFILFVPFLFGLALYMTPLAIVGAIIIFEDLV